VEMASAVSYPEGSNGVTREEMIRTAEDQSQDRRKAPWMAEEIDPQQGPSASTRQLRWQLGEEEVGVRWPSACKDCDQEH
jgi:hypothetical protein